MLNKWNSQLRFIQSDGNTWNISAGEKLSAFVAPLS